MPQPGAGFDRNGCTVSALVPIERPHRDVRTGLTFRDDPCAHTSL